MLWNTQKNIYEFTKMIKKLWRCVFHQCVQKQTPEVFYKKAVLKNFVIFTEKHLCWTLFLIKRLQHGFFPVNIVKFLRMPILRNIRERMLLCVFQYPEAVVCRCSSKQVFLKFCKSHRKLPVLDSLFNKVTCLKDFNFIKKRLQHRSFPVTFAKNFKNIFFYRTKAASEYRIEIFFVISEKTLISRY